MDTKSSDGTTFTPPVNQTSFTDVDPTGSEGVSNLASAVPVICMMILAVGLSVLTNTFTVYILNRTDSLHQTESLLYKALAVSEINSAASQAITYTLYLIHITQGCMPVYLYTVFVIYSSVVIVVFVNINRFIISPRCCYKLAGNVCRDYAKQNNLISDLASNILLSAPISLGLAVIVVTGGGILYTSRKQARKIAHLRQNVLRHHGQSDLNNPEGNHRAVAPNGVKGLRTVGVISLSYLVVWLPPLCAFGAMRKFVLKNDCISSTA